VYFFTRGLKLSKKEEPGVFSNITVHNHSYIKGYGCVEQANIT